MYFEINFDVAIASFNPAKEAALEIANAIDGSRLEFFQKHKDNIRNFTGAAMDAANKMLLQDAMEAESDDPQFPSSAYFPSEPTWVKKKKLEPLPFYENVEMSATENPSSLRLRFENLAESFLRTANGWNAFVVPTGSSSQADAIIEYMSGGNGPLGLVAIEKKLIWLYEAKYKPHVPQPMRAGEPAWLARIENKIDKLLAKTINL